MPTQESVAIREEGAIARIEKATSVLNENRDSDIPTLNLKERKIHALERQAFILERTAEMLESLAGIEREDPEAVPTDAPAEVEPGDSAGTSDMTPTQISAEPTEPQEEEPQPPPTPEPVPAPEPEPVPLPPGEADEGLFQDVTREGEEDNGDDYGSAGRSGTTPQATEPISRSKTVGVRRK